MSPNREGKPLCTAVRNAAGDEEPTMTSDVVDPFEEWRSTRRADSSTETPKATLPDGTAAMERAWKTSSEVDRRTRERLAAWVQDEKPKGFASGFFLWGLVVFVLIPFVGWCLGPLLMVAAFTDGKSPERRARERGERDAQFRREAENSYLKVTCPRCNCRLVAEDSCLVFYSDPAGINCTVCGTRLIRRGDMLAALEAVRTA